MGQHKNRFGKEHEREIMADYRNTGAVQWFHDRHARAGRTAAITRALRDVLAGSFCTPPEAVDQPVHNWLFQSDAVASSPGNLCPFAPSF